MYQVELTYFKDTGKYYATGSYTTHRDDLGDVWEEVRLMLFNGNRPGLVDGSDGFHVLVEVPGHPHAHPRLLPSAG